MNELRVKPIPTRNWKSKDFDSVVERDKARKKSQMKVDERIHYLWFNYLQLCLNLEEINFSIKKKGAKGKILGETFVEVDRDFYFMWDLKELPNMTFHEWYFDDNHRELFLQGGFEIQRGARYHSIVKRFNVFIEYYNRMNREVVFNEGEAFQDSTKEMKVCSDIIEKYQKERFMMLKKNVASGKSTFTELVNKDLKQCGFEILNCSIGVFPKSK